VSRYGISVINPQSLQNQTKGKKGKKKGDKKHSSNIYFLSPAGDKVKIAYVRKKAS